MALIDEQIEQRELGQFPLSIGTSLALEGAFGIYPERETNVEHIQSYDTFWVNIDTIYRNLYNSLNRDLHDRVHDRNLLEPVLGELRTLLGVIETRVEHMSVHLYYNSAESLKSYFPNASFRHPTTQRQRIYASIRDSVMRWILRNSAELHIERFDIRIKGHGKALMLTHQPVELLSDHYFDHLDLLESHTGEIKPKTRWGSKLYSRDETLPFNPFTLQLFGDREDFSPKPIKYRRPVMEIARRERWNPTTRVRRMRSAVRAIRDEDIRTTLMSLFDYRSI